MALAVFWLNLLLLGSMLYVSWRYASAKGLLRDGVSHEAWYAVKRRIVLAQALYAVGFAVSLFSTLLSIAAIVLVELIFAIAPTVLWGKRQGPAGDE
jgi:uncharacterized membrane protein